MSLALTAKSMFDSIFSLIYVQASTLASSFVFNVRSCAHLIVLEHDLFMLKTTVPFVESLAKEYVF